MKKLFSLLLIVVCSGLFSQTKTVDSIEAIIKPAIRIFYSSLEQTKEENDKAYASGAGFKNKNVTNNFVTNASYDKKRIDVLTGQYHYNHNIKLLDIQSVERKNADFIAKVSVEYVIREVGVFNNEELILLCNQGGKAKVAGWFDVSPKLTESFVEEGVTDQTLYSIIGTKNVAGLESSQKTRRINDSITKFMAGVENDQQKFGTLNKCPSCPSNVALKYVTLMKAGKFAEVKALTSLAEKKTECKYLVDKVSFTKLAENAKYKNEIENSFGNIKPAATPHTFYVNNDYAFVGNFLETSASVQPILLVKDKGIWKIQAFCDRDDKEKLFQSLSQKMKEKYGQFSWDNYFYYKIKNK